MSQQRDDWEQAKARLDRTGQTRPVTFWHMIAPGTVDSVILQSHRDRTSLETAMLKHIQDG
jgi:SNF2 family DNA or RNA helicase